MQLYFRNGESSRVNILCQVVLCSKLYSNMSFVLLDMVHVGSFSLLLVSLMVPGGSAVSSYHSLKGHVQTGTSVTDFNLEDLSSLLA